MNTKHIGLLPAAFFTFLSDLNPAIAQTWLPASAPSFNWHDVASSADGTKLVAVATAGPILISTNSGGTWATTSAPTQNWFSVACSADGTRLLATATENGTYISTNSAAIWTVITNAPAPNYMSSVASSADGTRLFVGFYDGVHHYGSLASSADSGITWTTLTNAPAAVCVSASADGIKLLVGAGPLGLVNFSSWFETSTDSGATWMVTSLVSSLGWNAGASSADGTRLVAVNADSSGFLYTSKDSGSTWTTNSAGLGGNWISVASSADGARLVAAQGGCFNPGGVGCGGPVYTSSDFGVTWVSNSVPDAFAVASSADGARLVAVTAAGGIYTLQSAPNPRLNITPAGPSLLLSWTVPSIDFALQQNSDPASTNWTDLTNTPTLNLATLQNQVAVPLSPGSRFYRLKH